LKLDNILDFLASFIDSNVPEEKELAKSLDKVIKLRNKLECR